jgi:hypothetical protein
MNDGASVQRSVYVGAEDRKKPEEEKKKSREEIGW